MLGKFRVEVGGSTPITPGSGSSHNGAPTPRPNTPFNRLLSPSLVCVETPSIASILMTPSNKRPQISDKENTLPSFTPTKKQRYTQRGSVAEKLELIFIALTNANWTLSEFLYHMFQTKDETGKDIHRTKQHSKYSQHFLEGKGRYTPAMVLDCWFRSPDGRLSLPSTSNTSLMYSTSTPYLEIKPVRPALTSFAAQIVQNKLVMEAKQAVKPSSGLHATSRRKGHQTVEWADIGATTVAKVSHIIQTHQPLTWIYMMSISEPDIWNSNLEGVKHD